MDKFVIQGETKLCGEVAVGGAKNSALPILASTLLADGPVILHDIPNLADISAMCELLGDLGVSIVRQNQTTLRCSVESSDNSHAGYDRVRKMRGSICVLGALLGRRGYARVGMPGGCVIGSRPIDMHLRGLRALGAEIELDGGDIVAKASRLRGASIFMGGPFGSTVLGTINVLMAAVLADGTTIIESAACEPEVEDLVDVLNAMGAKITGGGTPRLRIEGVDELHGVEHTIIPDRIEAGTFMMAAAITGGEINIRNARMDHLFAVVDKLRDVGVHVEQAAEGITVAAGRRLTPVDVTTQPYPGFPTDLQAQMMSLLCLVDGNSAVIEKIFPDRYMHMAELLRLGADIRKEGAVAIITGVDHFVAAPVMASDLRASAALVLAGLAGRGETEVRRVYHIDRGYEKIEEKLRPLGANIKRTKE